MKHCRTCGKLMNHWEGLFFLAEGIIAGFMIRMIYEVWFR